MSGQMAYEAYRDARGIEGRSWHDLHYLEREAWAAVETAFRDYYEEPEPVKGEHGGK